ncbi:MULTISPECIES: ABC transporter ATP-binding protein [unclassified Rhodococcus (in: high G+C Gram-positive bacteria)]|uniref:ABC transporter ATP-binding protein n=1 Tax=unclassified Rhodococcus (in: high G+C Gram-positive bacteria) TaxID=192944 RepID=UPI001C9B0369|nr:MULTISPECIES: ABC transporter ATP-binding protein [unclassified Rhodococcus (in: high G+C Gram-positive bacteria)]MBY6603970.1 ABC transporter ATP-binding protein [Rhodococcus sp. BP-351]MBY6608307.1 ABC transporter ATP-binding protein [Rhodococcus sp. BP-361]MBY6612645.1 ABC transporter ATP-binding protein [Rhodococcus sp. BP-360]MBY6626073.1 ABC transporter ATP-binding protein [Rhodococcus sp. BP-350]
MAAARFALALAMRADRVRTVATGTAQIAAAVAGVAIVLAAKAVLELVQNNDSATALLWPLLILTVIMSLVSGSATIRAQQERILGEKVQQVIWSDVLGVVSSVDLISYEDTGFISRFSEIEREGMSRPLAMTRSLFGFVGGMIGTTTMVVVLLVLAPAIAPVLLLGAVPTVLISRRSSRVEFEFARRNSRLYLLAYSIRQVLTQRQFAAEVRSFGAAEHLTTRHAHVNTTFMSALSGHIRTRTVLATAQVLVATVSLAGALLIIVYLLESGTLTLATAGAAVIAARLLGTQLASLYSAMNGLSEAQPFVNELRHFLRWPTHPTSDAGSLTLAHGVDLTDVHFSYPQSDRAALCGVSIHIGAGEVVALVGENGSGKSTLATIVSGLYRPDRGEVRWDGVTVDPDVVRANVGTVFQDFGRYSLDVTDNIALAGLGERDPSAVRDAADDAHIADVIDRLPHGFDTVLGRDIDEGMDLSGGQWQRLALARALFKKAPLLVLDEPSAALDPRAESELFEDVRTILDGRAALLISHRFANVRLADRIYVLQSGLVIESGTHHELMAAGGTYAELFTMQSAGYDTTL